ncbi:hypothetical protein [Clostridium thermarum]|nr:hypothetical protein [Clostridium thermarum]
MIAMIANTLMREKINIEKRGKKMIFQGQLYRIVCIRYNLTSMFIDYV